MKRVSSSSSNKEKSPSSSLRCPIFRSQISPVPSSNPLSPVRQMQIHHPNCPTVPTQGFLFLIKGWWRVLDGHGVAGGSGSHENGGGGGNQSPQSSVLEQDRFLQIANIGRIMKKALRANRKIAEDAKDTVHECVSEFISFLTSYYALQCSEYSLIC